MRSIHRADQIGQERLGENTKAKIHARPIVTKSQASSPLETDTPVRRGRGPLPYFISGRALRATLGATCGLAKVHSGRESRCAAADALCPKGLNRDHTIGTGAKLVR